MLFDNLDNKNLVTIGLILIIISSLLTYNLYISSNYDDRGTYLGIFDTFKNILGFLPTIPVQMPTKMPNIVQRIRRTITRVEEPKKEVFNIDDNNYTYNDAQLLCKAFDSDLATEEQLIDAHRNGANWCNYGWSANKHALYPTQKSHYLKLQKGDANLRNSCGVPGVNGGVFKNTNLKFGVNCFGVKPKPDPSKIRYLSTNTISEPVLIDSDVEKLNDLKKMISGGKIPIRPYQNSKWSKYSFKKSIYNLKNNNINLEKEVGDANKDPNLLEQEQEKVSIEDSNVL
jgi:hypothetical protein